MRASVKLARTSAALSSSETSTPNTDGLRRTRSRRARSSASVVGMSTTIAGETSVPSGRTRESRTTRWVRLATRLWSTPVSPSRGADPRSQPSTHDTTACTAVAMPGAGSTK